MCGKIIISDIARQKCVENEILVDTRHGHRGPRESSLQLAQK